MRIDLHVHTSNRSACGKHTEHEQIRAAIRHGLDGIAICDHDTYVPRDTLRELNLQYAPFHIFTGIERNVDNEHILILGLYEPLIQEKEWSYPALHAFVKEKGGCLILAHPFRFHPPEIDVQTYSPDAIERHSLNIREETGHDTETLIQQCGSRAINNSDAHRTEGVGSYSVELTETAQTDEDLVRLLRTGAFECRCDEALVEKWKNTSPQK